MTNETSPSAESPISDGISAEVRQLMRVPQTVAWEADEDYSAMVDSFAKIIQPGDEINLDV
jgi:hypothetical protein